MSPKNQFEVTFVKEGPYWDGTTLHFSGSNAFVFYAFVQFLNYAQSLDFKIEYLGSIAYRKVVFKLRDFLEYQDSSIKPTNRYRLKKIKEFFQQLQSGLHVASFTDSRFQSLVLIPQVQFEKCPKQKFLIGKIWLVEDLFHYKYPFRIPDLFELDLKHRKLSKYENLVRVEFIKTFSSRDVEKSFYIREFLNTYKISNQKIKEIKQIFIDIIHIFQQYQLIEKEGLLMLNRSPIDSYDLKTSNISDGIILYEKITTNLFLNDKV